MRCSSGQQGGRRTFATPLQRCPSCERVYDGLPGTCECCPVRGRSVDKKDTETQKASAHSELANVSARNLVRAGVPERVAMLGHTTLAPRYLAVMRQPPAIQSG